jgi:NADPH-dependent 2,4-dienoyl-CoA reductase/sulfur reductase-like enzyme
MRRLVVIGGDAAGMTAASQARRGAGRDDLEIVVLERGTRTSYAACGLPYLVEGTVTSPDHLVARTPAEFRERGIDARIRHEVTAIDTDGRRVTVRDLDGDREFDQPYDDLMIATGATGLRPPLPGIDAGGVLELRTIDDALALDDLIGAGASRAVVVGAGYIGIEVAEALLARGLQVAVVELLGHSMAATLDRPMAQLVDAALRDAGVDLHLDTAVTGFATDGGRVTGVGTAGGTLPADVVVLGMGSARRPHWPSPPASPWVTGAGSSSTTTCARRSPACGPQATVWSRSIGSAADRACTRWAPTPTSRAGWPAST